jgi:hypothetical protein
MTKLEKIEQDIAALSSADLRKLTAWLADYQVSQRDQANEKSDQSVSPADKADVERRLRLIEELAGAGARYGSLRSGEEIDALIREIRGDD